MSLVHQALRKAEQEKLRRTGIVVAQPVTVPAPPPARPVAAAQTAEPLVGQTSNSPSAEHGPPGFHQSRAAVPGATGTAPRPTAVLVPVLVSCVAFVAIVATVVIVLRSSAPAPRIATEPAAGVSSAHSPTVTEPAPPAPPAAAGANATPAASAADADRYQLTGITKDPADGRPMAIVNGQLRSEGQFIDGATVQKIERDRVTLVVEGRTIVKRLF